MTIGHQPDVAERTFAALQMPPAREAASVRLAPRHAEIVPTRSTYLRFVKPALDAIIGAVLAVLLLPLIAVVALAVLVTSGRPVLYGSLRRGRDGRLFTVWKFRTMVADADDHPVRWQRTDPHLAGELAANWKLRDDPRVTPLGRFLRRSSLDELPQFWNVLRGEMSLVGPRPYLAREQLDPKLAPAILAVRPGLTGPFQVRGRNDLRPDERMRIEAGYASEAGLLRDLGYMVRTVKPLFRMDGQ